MQLQTIVQGAGSPTLVLLHFFGSSSQEYLPVIEQLEGKYRCVAPDLRGFGASSTAPDSDYSVDAMTDDVFELIQKDVKGDYIVVGHSMSGKVALNLATRQPAGLLGLVLLAPSPLTPEPIDDDERHRLLTTHGQQSAAEETLRKITAVTLSDAHQQQIISDDLRSSDEAWKAWLEKGSRENIEDRIRQVMVPVRIVLGSKDDHITKELMDQTILKLLPQTELSRIEGAAHVLPLEKPAKVARILDTFAAWLLSKQIPIPSEGTKLTPLAD